MKKYLLLLSILIIPCIVFSENYGFKNANDSITNWVDLALKDAEDKALLMAQEMTDIPKQLPQSVDSDENLVTSGSEWWCSGFFPGVLWYLYENSGNEQLTQIAAYEELKSLY